MKIICINNNRIKELSRGRNGIERMPLTVGKAYDSIEVRVDNNKSHYLIVDDDGETNNPLGFANLYGTEFFKTEYEYFREMREKRLKEVLCE
jgi:GH15 family glucan-1,4-alpha-glucosidase